MLSSLASLHALLALLMFVVTLTAALLLLVISRSFPVFPIRIRVFVLLVFGFVLAGTLSARFFDIHGRLFYGDAGITELGVSGAERLAVTSPTRPDS